MIRQQDRTRWALGLAALMLCLTAPLGAQTAPESAPAEPLLDLGTPEVTFLACTASAICGDGTSIACSAASGSCTGVNANCATGQRGYVTCGSTTTQCSSPPCPAGTYYCEDVNAGVYGNICPATCITRSDGLPSTCRRTGARCICLF